VTNRLNLFLQDKNIVRLTIALVVVSILVPGLFKVGPPQWLHVADKMPEMTNDDVAGTGVSPEVSDDKNTVLKSDDGASVAVIAESLTTSDVEKTGSETAPETAPETASDLAVADKNTSQKEPQIAARVQAPLASVIDPTKQPTASKPSSRALPMAVPRNFERVIPPSHAALPIEEQKEQFIKILLPLILASNEEIIERRAAILRAFDRQDTITLGKWAKLYKLPPENVDDKGFLDDLLERVDVIPVPLALAQGAIESGWGTSRFAQQGNALFGQWAWQDDAGIKPLNASNKNAVVRSFPNLLGSVRAYMHNLNTHYAYQDFRDSRKKIAKTRQEDKANILVNHLHGYAEIGAKYVKDIRVVMRKNKLRTYANAFLS
jgi:Bax protein